MAPNTLLIHPQGLRSDQVRQLSLLCVLDPSYVILSLSVTAETPDTLVFYTLNGRRPEPFQRSGKPHTFPFKESFALNPGKVYQLLEPYKY